MAGFVGITTVRNGEAQQTIALPIPPKGTGSSQAHQHLFFVKRSLKMHTKSVLSRESLRLAAVKRLWENVAKEIGSGTLWAQRRIFFASFMNCPSVGLVLHPTAMAPHEVNHKG